MDEIMKLYHTGFEEIVKPDIHFGRKNADFGQGFYMSGEYEFSGKWARVRRGMDTVLNSYKLDLSGLCVHLFERDLSWFEYIYANRNHLPDALPYADVIIGPIANDTIFDTLGITTSGLLDKEHSLRLLMLGPVYNQIVIKSEKAASQLKWLKAEILDEETVRAYRKETAAEEAVFTKQFAQLLDTL